MEFVCYRSQGFNLANDTESNLFEELAKHSERGRRYADVMTWFTKGLERDTAIILDLFRWRTPESGLVVDVGGSHGSLSLALARRFPFLRCIVQDRSHVVAQGREQVPPESADRVSFMEHDFFKEQPVKGADVYLLHFVLHDWSDKYAAQLLRALVPALKTGARVVLVEAVVPEPGCVSLYQEKQSR